ncbi:MAG TPA: DUF2812 domain-containing protein [Paenibacillus sp.]|jgi:hypothetical protein
MRKYKFFTDFDREEQWLNEMARSGYLLVNKAYSYEFTEGSPEDANYRIDYRTFKKRQDFEDYRTLFEDSGWKHIAGTKSSGAQYFKQVKEQGDEDIFSDVDSKAARYKRLSEMWMSLAGCFIPLFAVLISTGAINITAFVKPKLLYYTPGLWEMNGSHFWRAFLFETPFALLRGFSWVILPIFILVYMIFAYKAKTQFAKTQQGR